MGYHANVEDITPERAELLLAHNYEENRRIREAYVKQLAEVMRQDRFVSENGQTIVVGDDDGILYDAQHRLMAMVQAQKTYRFIVAYIVDGKEKFKTIDANTPRKVADFISLPYKNQCAALAGPAAAIEWGHAPLISAMQGKWDVKSNIDRGLVVLFCEQNPERVLEYVKTGFRMRDAASCGTVKAYSVFIEIVKYVDDFNVVDEFIEEFCRLTPTSKTIAACKKTLVNAYMGKKVNPTVRWVVGTLLDAYFHYLNGDGGVMLNKQDLRFRYYSDKLEAKRQKNACLIA